MERFQFSEPKESDSIEERKERVLGVLGELLSGKNKDDELLKFWRMLLSQEAELIHELRHENQILSGLLGVGGLAQVVSDSTSSTGKTDDATDDKNDAKSAMLKGVKNAKTKKKRTRSKRPKKKTRII